MTDRERELTEAEKAVLVVVADEGRVNAHLVCEETGLDEEPVSDAFRTLLSTGAIEKVSRGLFDFVTDPRDRDNVRGIPEIPNKDTQTAPIDPTMIDETDRGEDD